MLLKDKSALITGSNRGIGYSILETFAREGCNTIWAHARCKSELFSKSIDELSDKYNTNIIPIYFDLTDSEKLKDQIKQVIKSKIPIDILVNNAGVDGGGLFSSTPISQIKSIFDVNLFGTMELTQPILRQMFKQKSGSVVNIGSVYGLDLISGNSGYGVSKAAIIAWTKVLANEMGNYGVRVNSISPGFANTDMGKKGFENIISNTKNNSNIKLADVQDIVNTILFLASDLSSYINGQTIRVDGGHIYT